MKNSAILVDWCTGAAAVGAGVLKGSADKHLRKVAFEKFLFPFRNLFCE